METIQKDFLKTLFHTHIIESELKQLNLDSQKAILQAWVEGLNDLRQKNKIAQIATFSAEILGKLLGYSTTGNSVTAKPDSSPEPFFDLLLGQFNLAGQKPSAALKLEPEGISPDAEKAFAKEAWKFTEIQDTGFYLLTDLNEIRLYPKRSKEKVYERFVLSELLQNNLLFTRFYLILNAINLLSGKTAYWFNESAKLFLDEKLKGKHKTLKEMYGPVHQGITTGLDEAFVIDDATKEKLVKEDAHSAEIIKPYAQKEDLDKWTTESRSLWLICTPENSCDIEKYPAVKNHLIPFKKKLEERPGNQKWFEWQQGNTVPKKMFEHKLGFSKQSHNPTFAVDKNGGAYDSTGLYTTELDYYLAGLMNSSVLWYLIRDISNKKKDGTYELTADSIEKLPVPDAPGLVRGRMGQLSNFCHEAVLERNDLIKYFRGQTAYNLLPGGLSAKLTPLLHNWFAHEFDAFRSEIIDSFKTDIPPEDLQLWNDYFYQEREKVFSINANIARAEKEIDLLVYELFELSPDEIDLIERTI